MEPLSLLRALVSLSRLQGVWKSEYATEDVLNQCTVESLKTLQTRVALSHYKNACRTEDSIEWEYSGRVSREVTQPAVSRGVT